MPQSPNWSFPVIHCTQNYVFIFLVSTYTVYILSSFTILYNQPNSTKPPHIFLSSIIFSHLCLNIFFISLSLCSLLCQRPSCKVI